MKNSKKAQRSATQNSTPHSAVTSLRFRGKDYFVKRDDTLHLFLSGNKYRKLYTLLQTPRDQYKKLISYGGSQSNAMLSMAYLASEKGWKFEYITKRIALHVKQNPLGNLAEALKLGMTLIEVAPEVFEQRVSAEFINLNAHELLVPQGGADPLAEEGVALLAREIEAFRCAQGLDYLSVATPSGTGTTAFYLAKHYQKGKIYTTPCVGDSHYLNTQMQALGAVSEHLKILLTCKHYHFAKPHQELLHVYQELKAAGVEFDLVYAPKMWMALVQQQIKEPLLYVHSGGLFGNASMLERYRYKGWY